MNGLSRLWLAMLGYLLGGGTVGVVSAQTLHIQHGPDPASLQLEHRGEAGKFYFLQEASGAGDSVWRDQGWVVGTGDTGRLYRELAGARQGFFRLQELLRPADPIFLNTTFGSPEFTRQGTWLGSALAGYGGSPTLFSADYDAWCAWRPTRIWPGRYRVHVFFPAHSSNIQQAEYTIVSEGGVDVVRVNQYSSGGQWVQVGGIYTFTPSACLVQLRRGVRDGSLRADAILFEAVPDTEEILLEPGANAREVLAVGQWVLSELAGHGGTASYTSVLTNAIYQWRLLSIPHGTYRVQVFFPASPANTTLAEYTIGSLSGVETLLVDQTVGGGDWVGIGGVHRFASGHGYVQLRLAQNGGAAVANAVKLVPTDEGETPGLQPSDPPLLSIGGLRPTLFFKNGDPLRQYAVLSILHRGATEYGRFTVHLGEEAGSAQIVGPIFGCMEVRVEVPDVAQPSLLSCSLQSLTHPTNLDAQVIPWSPQKKWKIYVLDSSHTDLGYEDYVRRKQVYLVDWAKEALGWVEENTSGDYRLGYHFFFEHLWWFQNYERVRGAAEMRDLLEHVHSGAVALGGSPTLGHGAWMGEEETARFTYPLMQEMRFRHGITNARTAFYADTDLPSWATVQALAGAGYRGLAVAPSDWRLGTTFKDRLRAGGMSPIFYWESPNGRDRLLTLLGEAYGQGLNLHLNYDLSRQNDHAQVVAWLSALELSGYPSDAVLTPRYLDNEHPNRDVHRFIEAWNRDFRYPEILHNAPLDRLFDHWATHGSDLPVYRGELNSPWADYATIDVTSHGAKREAALLTARGETLATLATFVDPAYGYPFAALRSLYEQFNEYNEHSWPTLPSAADFHVVNTKYYKTQRARDRLKPQAEAIVQRAFTSLLAGANTAGRSILVFNPELGPRSGYVQVPGEPLGAEPFVILHPLTGASVPYQKLSDGQVLFFAEGVPSCGYHVFPVEARPDAPVFSSTLGASAELLSNDFYVVHFDSQTGGMDSLWDREVGQELIQPGQVLNRYIYRYNYYGQGLVGTNYSPLSATRTVEESGPLRAVLRTVTSESQSGAAIVQRVILYRDLKRIDIVNELNEVDRMWQPFSGASSQNMDVRYRDNLFYAFPFAIPDFRLQVAGAAGVAFDFMDTNALLWSRLSNKDYACVDNWVNIAGPAYGVTFVTRDAPILHFGEIRYNQKSTTYVPTNAALYSHVQSSRLGPHNFLQVADCNHRVRYSITSGPGDWVAADAPRFGRESATELLAGVIPGPQDGGGWLTRSGSLLSVSEANVALSVLKQSEVPGRGLIVRLRETQGRDVTQATLTFNLFAPAAVFRTDLAESDAGAVAVPVQGNQVHFELRKFDWITLRIRAQVDVAGVSDLTAVAITDGTATLQWTPVPGAQGYNVYRSTQGGFQAHAYNRIAHVGQPALADDGMSPGSEYHYKVAALNWFNEEGPAAELSLTTDTSNRTPPLPVADLLAMTLPNSNGIPRVALDWPRGPESDIARYRIYRSTQSSFFAALSNLLAEVEDDGHPIQQHIDDRGLSGNTTYHYKVAPVDQAGLEQPVSPQTTVTTLIP